ncbi:transferase [Lithospermum erythrorhizon]|uniref:Transferase n=1 Tax=Lithospermum erythrorhizon TaxID=34254 RepID=A0AAV3Q5U0_LITER
MRPWRCTRVFILLFLTVSVFIPIILLSHRLKYDNSYVSKEFVEDLSIMDKGELLNEPSREVYKDVGFNSQVLVISSDEENRSIESGNVSRSSDEESRGSESRNSLSTSNEENESIESGDMLHSSDKKNSSGSVKALSLPDKEESSESGNELIAFDEDTSRVSGNALSVSDGENISSESEKAAEDVNLSKREGTSNDKGDRPNKTEADLHTSQKRKHPVLEKKKCVSSSVWSMAVKSACGVAMACGEMMAMTRLLRLLFFAPSPKIYWLWGHSSQWRASPCGVNSSKVAARYMEEQTRPTTKAQHNQGSQRDASDEKVKEMKDQILRATVYLNFLPPGSNSHIAKELRLRIREVERVLGGSIKDSDLPRRSFQKMNAMEATLAKASHIYPDCEAMSTNLHAMTYNTEEQVRRQKEQTAFLFHLAGRTTPKGLHCLSMRLTSEFFVLLPDDRELPNQHKLNDQSLYHFGVFSDNVLACAVVVNSTVSAAEVTSTVSVHLFHSVTQKVNNRLNPQWILICCLRIL